MDRALLDKEPEPVEYTQLTVTSGFNEDVIAEQRPAVNYSTASLDNQGWIYYTSGVQEQGSLPTDRNITSSTGVQYRLAAYDKPNAATLIKKMQLPCNSTVLTKRKPFICFRPVPMVVPQ